jgi:hypothetical protein
MWDRDKDGKSLNKPEHGFNHALDGIRYFMQRHLKKTDNGVANFYDKIRAQRSKPVMRAGLR